MKQFWDSRYRDIGFAYGDQPNDFLAQEVHRIPTGRVLCLAEGEGRNAVFLAQQGYQVTAVDQSPIGLQKAQVLAQKHGVSLETIAADLATFDIGPSAWDGIVSIWAHVPPSIRERVHGQVASGLKPGGVFILEAYTEAQLETPGRGGPPREQKEMLMSLNGLETELDGLSFLIGQEIERDIDEGIYHQGKSAVVQVVAIRSVTS